MPPQTTQITKTLNTTGELIFSKATDTMSSGCSAYKVRKVSGQRVLVCITGVHTLGDPQLGPFWPVDIDEVFAAHGDQITSVWAKAESATTTIDAGPLARRSPPSR